MALVDCPECDRAISDAASVCPSRGRPLHPASTGAAVSPALPPFVAYEYRSKRTLFGLPLVHVLYGPAWLTGLRPARGIVANGNVSVGVIAFGGIAARGLAVGGVSLGLVSLGGLALGAGGISTGYIALGGIAIGVITIGGPSIHLNFSRFLHWKKCITSSTKLNLIIRIFL